MNWLYHYLHRLNAIKLRIPPFEKGGQGGFKSLKDKIPLSPPFSKGEAKSLNLMALLHRLHLKGESGLFLSFILWLLVACAPQPPLPSPGHIHTTPTRPPADDIPPPVQRPRYIPPPPPSASSLETYSVVITDMPVKNLLIALANDTKMNIDIYPGITGTVTLNAIEQTLPQILDRIAKQVDLYYEIQGSNLVITPNEPIVRTYKVGYVNMMRDSTSNVDISTQIISSLDQIGGSQGGGGGSGGGGGGGGGDNNSTTKISNISNNHFWD
ncbi:MAG: hypothetical protein BWK79_16830, partial [Beggiatoa sp. IS2]